MVSQLSLPESTLALLQPGSFRRVELYRIVTIRGDVRRFTTNNRLVRYGGEDYLPNFGISASSAETRPGGAAASSEISGVLDADGVIEQEVELGVYEGALGHRYVVDFSKLHLQPFRVDRFVMGRATLDLGSWRAELRSVGVLLDREVGRTHGRQCGYDYGDTMTCKQNIGSLTSFDCAITGITDDLNYDVSGVAVQAGALKYPGGQCTFTTGVAKGLGFRVESAGGVSMVLSEPPPIAVSVGDRFDISNGCDRTQVRCIELGNIRNFGGYNMSGDDKVTNP